MSKFRFRLETYLRLKIAARDQCRAELAEVLRAEQQLKEHQEAIESDIQDQHTYIRGLTQAGSLNVDLITASQREVVFLKALQAEKQQLMVKLQPHIQQRRQALIDADHEVRTLEKLKEQKHEQHLQLETAQESKQMDEIALSGFMRKGE
ncbi:flagellar biosynthesis chaperone [Bremerella volcania]|uniref:Flagellar FliJ protein n=1 Tax=Bremerella volcania TaxID=2527984 RepID=A0A518C5D1_9BACT|nr:flagellar FliJ family protein [Bremerella volcania]QDU74422.1 flagellar biosynthesis chaperone [Bremerella volcania]